MIRIEVAEAETIFDEMLDRVEQGETFVLLQNGEPIATIVPPRPDAENQHVST